MGIEIDKVAEYIKQVADAASPALQQGYQLGLTAIQFDALRDIVFGAIFLTYAIFVFRRLRTWLSDHAKSSYADDLALGVKAYGGGATGIIAALISVLTLLDVWVWVKLFHPEAYLARALIAKAVGI